MTPVDLMNLRAVMGDAFKSVGYVIVTMIVVMVLMKRIVRQQRAHQKNLLVQKIIVFPISGDAMANLIVPMPVMNG